MYTEFYDADDNSGTVNVRTLVADHPQLAEGLLRFMGGIRADDTTPTPGENGHISDFEAPGHYLTRFEQLLQATHVTIPFTTWGDYVGSTVERSNHRSILDGFADQVIDLAGDYSSSMLVIPLDGTIPTELANVIVALYDYPLVNEDDHSQLEFELGEEAWDDYGRSDLRRNVVKNVSDAMPDLPSKTEYAIGDAVSDTIDEMDDSDFDTLVWKFRDDAGLHFVAEDATGGGYWEGADDVVKAIAQKLTIDAIAKLALTDPQWTPAPSVDGQKELFCN